MRQFNNMFNNNDKVVKQVEELKTTILLQNELFSKFLTKLDDVFVNLNKKTDDNNGWLKEFHRLALNEYMSGPRKRVYTFIYNKKKDSESRIIMASRDTFEEANEVAKQSLIDLGYDPDKEWTMAAYKSIDIYQESSDIVNKIEKQISYQKPVDAYIHEISLLRDKFCTKPSEIKVVDGLINKIKEIYAAKSE